MAFGSYCPGCWDEDPANEFKERPDKTSRLCSRHAAELKKKMDDDLHRALGMGGGSSSGGSTKGPNDCLVAGCSQIKVPGTDFCASHQPRRGYNPNKHKEKS